MLPLTGVADLEPGDVVGNAHVPHLSVQLDALQHAICTAEPHPRQTASCQVSAVTRLLDTGEGASFVTSPFAVVTGTIEPRPAFFALTRLGPTAITPAGDCV